MEILVNQEPLTFTLESEERLGEVIDGIAQWLKEGQYAITAIDVDDKSVPIHDRTAWQDLHVESVDRLSLEAFPLSQVEQITLAAIRDYCLLLERSLEQEDSSAVADLAEELPYVREKLESFFPALAASDDAEALLGDPVLQSGHLPAGSARSSVLVELKNLTGILESRLREFREPVRELALTLGQLMHFAEPLSEVPIQLQTNEESLAMSTVVQFTELLSRVIRLIPLVEEADAQAMDTGRISSFALDLTPFLQQLQDAFEVRDSVLIGDLLEYEIAPRLKELHLLAPANSGEES